MKPNTTRPFLHTALDQSLTCPPEFGQALSNHLPMALQALFDLGASDLAMAQFAKQYRGKHFPDAPTTALAPPTQWPNWAQHLGEFGAFERFQAHFLWQLATQPAPAVLASAVPLLWPGLGAVALHGAIRVAHAIDATPPSVLASAWAYWAARWQDLPGQAERPLPLHRWQTSLLGVRADVSGNLIADRMQAMALTQAYRQSPLALPLGAPGLRASLHDLAAHMARLYAQSGSFTVLHVVTGTRAVLRLLAFAPPRPQAVISAVATAALLAAQVGAAQPGAFAPTQISPQASPQGIADLLQPSLRALEQGAWLDDHAIKLVHACWHFAQHQQHPAFLHAAARALKVAVESNSRQKTALGPGLGAGSGEFEAGRHAHVGQGGA